MRCMGHGKRHHGSGHCTARNVGTQAPYRWQIHCMEYKDRGTRQKVTAMHGSYGRKDTEMATELHGT